MFRKPMRLEKWVAFDGAIGAEVIEAVQEAAVDDSSADSSAQESGHHDGNSLFTANIDAAFDVETDVSLADFMSRIGTMDLDDSVDSIDLEFEYGDDGEASLEMPGGFDLPDAYDGGLVFPFLDADVDFSISDDRSIQDLFFEITFPENGEFYFLDLQTFRDMYSSLGFEVGDRLVVTNGTYMSNGAMQGYIGEVNSWGIGTGSPAFMVESFTADDGSSGIRIGFMTGNMRSGDVELVLRSLAFKSENAEGGIGDSFSVSIFHNENTNLYNPSDAGAFHDGAGGFFNRDENPPKSEGELIVTEDGVNPGPGPEDPEPGDPDPEDPDPGDPDPEDPDPGDPDPEDPEPGDPDPEDPVDPDPDPDPVTPPVTDGGSSDGSGDAGNSGVGDNTGGDSGIGDGGTDAGGDSSSGNGGEGDSGGDGILGQDDVVNTYRRDESQGGDASDADEGSESVEEVEGEAVVIEDREIESAATAIAMQLAQNLEVYLVAFEEDRAVLESALSRLQDEYFFRPTGEWGGLREFLREMFTSGNRELQAINRILEQIQKQIGEFRDYAPERRDGMLIDSIAELLDSAGRRNAETTALTGSLDAVADLLARCRIEGLPLPTEQELSALFERTYEDAVAKWRERDARSDPMGKELAGKKIGR